MRARGFTLLETIFATGLLTLGLLAVAASARASYRLSSLGARLAHAAGLAASRLSRLEAAGCAASSGTSSSAPFAEAWVVTVTPGLRRIDLTISFAYEGRNHATSYRAATLCLPELP